MLRREAWRRDAGTHHPKGKEDNTFVLVLVWRRKQACANRIRLFSQGLTVITNTFAIKLGRSELRGWCEQLEQYTVDAEVLMQEVHVADDKFQSLCEVRVIESSNVTMLSQRMCTSRSTSRGLCRMLLGVRSGRQCSCCHSTGGIELGIMGKTSMQLHGARWCSVAPVVLVGLRSLRCGWTSEVGSARFAPPPCFANTKNKM